MGLNKLYKGDKKVISFEMFPPNQNYDWEKAEIAAKRLATLCPDFISITYGAGGNTKSNTIDLAIRIKKEYGIEPMVHLVCMNSTRAEIDALIKEFKGNHIENILALRGDYPKDGSGMSIKDFEYASVLTSYLKENGSFTVAGACYPEGHVEAKSLEEDLEHLLIKQNQGAEFFLTQLFFDNELFYSFVRAARDKGITVPIIPGIFPLTNLSQIDRIIKMAGCYIPKNLQDMIEKYMDDSVALKEAGIKYAIDQINDLLQKDVPGVHLYTMNNYENTKKIVDGIIK